MCSDLLWWVHPSPLARRDTELDFPIRTGRLALEAGEETRRLWPRDLCSPARPLCNPVSGLWLGVFGPVGQMGLGLPGQPKETRDPSSFAIFWLSAPHHAEAARLGMTETTVLLLAADLGHREGGHGEGCSPELQASSVAPSDPCIRAPRPEGVGPGDLEEVARVALSPSFWSHSACRAPGNAASRDRKSVV